MTVPNTALKTGAYITWTQPVAIKVYRILRSQGALAEAAAYDDDLTAAKP